MSISKAKNDKMYQMNLLMILNRKVLCLSSTYFGYLDVLEYLGTMEAGIQPRVFGPAVPFLKHPPTSEGRWDLKFETALKSSHAVYAVTPLCKQLCFVMFQ